VTFVSPGKHIQAMHRYDCDAPEYFGCVRSCFPLGEDIYAITFDTGYDSVITITTREYDVRSCF
jgi:hypothetical protein